MENITTVDQEETPEVRQEKIEKLNKKIEKEEKKEKSGWFGLVMAIVAALAIRALGFEPYNIPSSSMVPSLLIGDYLFITKFDYGYSRFSFIAPFSSLLPHGRLFYIQPERGDIVVFRKPPENNTDYIKRVIGIPGDTIQLKAGRLYINNQLVQRENQGQEYWDTEAGHTLYTRYKETLPNGVSHDIYEISDNGKYDETAPIEVPENHFFMMGDNRDNSLDSRYFGTVPAENLEGKARLIFYSTNGGGWFFQFWKWSEFLRLERFFTDIK